MAHFAKIDANTNIVITVNVVNNSDLYDLEFPESEAVGIKFLKPWTEPGTYWKQTSYNSKFRKNYAGIGMIYHPEPIDGFAIPQPFPSWIFDADTCQWEPPVPRPQIIGNELYMWVEDKRQWVLVST